MARIVLDTNTLISALGWKEGTARRAFEQCLHDENTLLGSPALLSELEDVLRRPKFSFLTDEEKLEFLGLLHGVSEIVEPKRTIHAIKDDPMDNKVLECAVEGKADLIISGDSHLLKLGQFEGIKIMNASAFLKLNQE
jgi:uncharacterized protein